MVGELNATRLPKLATSGSKAELIERILSAEAEELPEALRTPRPELESMKGAELKSRIDALNETRAGLLPTSGSRHDLAEILRANGVEVTLWSDVQAEWMKNNGHRNVLSAEQFEQLRNMRDAIMAHPAASKLLSAPGESELSAYWMQKVVDPKTGEVIGEQLCRARPDKWRKDGILIDLKTTEDASEEEFARSIAKWSYEVQDDFYLHGIAEALRQCGGFEDFAPPRAFVFIAVEKTACVVDGQAKGVAVYRLDDESRALGRTKWMADLATYTKCQNSGEWPGYAITIRQIKLPAWQFQRAAAATAE
jgi:exodeoxyribonuclease VIII